MNYKQARNYLSKRDVILIYAPISGISTSFNGEPVKAMIQPNKKVHDIKRAAVELRKFLCAKKSPCTDQSNRGNK